VVTIEVGEVAAVAVSPPAVRLTREQVDPAPVTAGVASHKPEMTPPTNLSVAAEGAAPPLAQKLVVESAAAEGSTSRDAAVNTAVMSHLVPSALFL